MSETLLADCAGWAKVRVRGMVSVDPTGDPFDGAADGAADGALTVEWAPDDWLVLSAAESGAGLVGRLEATAGSQFVTVVDVSHGYWLSRLTGPGAAATLRAECAIDLSDNVVSNGTAFRSLVAGIPVTVIRDDEPSARSYLVLCDRSYGRYLGAVLTDAIPR